MFAQFSYQGAKNVQNSKNFFIIVYISMNFLGHSFLHSAFTVDYSLDGISYSIFIIETDTQNLINLIDSRLKKI